MSIASGDDLKNLSDGSTSRLKCIASDASAREPKVFAKRGRLSELSSDTSEKTSRRCSPRPRASRRSRGLGTEIRPRRCGPPPRNREHPPVRSCRWSVLTDLICLHIISAVKVGGVRAGTSGTRGIPRPTGTGGRGKFSAWRGRRVPGSGAVARRSCAGVIGAPCRRTGQVCRLLQEGWEP